MTIEQIYNKVLSDIEILGDASLDSIPLTSDLGKAVITKVAKLTAQYHLDAAIIDIAEAMEITEVRKLVDVYPLENIK